jgi:hypothetical protein
MLDIVSEGGATDLSTKLEQGRGRRVAVSGVYLLQKIQTHFLPGRVTVNAAIENRSSEISLCLEIGLPSNFQEDGVISAPLSASATAIIERISGQYLCCAWAGI